MFISFPDIAPLVLFYRSEGFLVEWAYAAWSRCVAVGAVGVPAGRARERRSLRCSISGGLHVYDYRGALRIFRMELQVLVHDDRGALCIFRVKLQMLNAKPRIACQVESLSMGSPRRPRLTPKENTQQPKTGSEVPGSLFLVKPLVLGDGCLVFICGRWWTLGKGKRMNRSRHTEKLMGPNQDCTS